MNSNNSIELSDSSPTSDSRLQDWRDVRSGRESSLRHKRVIGVFLLLAAGLFSVWALQPLGKTSLQIISVGSSGGIHGDGDSHGDVGGNHKRTVAGRMAANSSRRFIEFSKQLITAKLSVLNAKTANQEWKGVVRSDQVQPRLIHLCGSFEIRGASVWLTVNAPQSKGRPDRVDVQQMIRAAGASRSPSVFVLDVIETADQSIGMTPELDAWQLARCVDREISEMQNARVAVIVQHTHVDAESDGKVSVSPLTRNLIAGLGSGADADRDRVLTVDELIESIASVGRKRSGRTLGKVFSSVELSQWKQFALVPITDSGNTEQESGSEAAEAIAKTADPESDAPTPNGDNLETGPGFPAITAVSNEAAQENAVKDLAVTAPTLALACQMQTAGLLTRDGDKAIETRRKLETLLDADSPREVALEWLESAPIVSLTWDEIAWMKTVMQRDAQQSLQPWSLQQSLIRCRIQANQLAIEPTVRQWLSESWKAAQWTRLDAERSFISPVRTNADTHPRRTVKQALLAYARLQRQCQSINDAKKTCREIHTHLEKLFSCPIHARSTTDDTVCQLLTQAIELQNWIQQRQSEGAHRCQMKVDSIKDLRDSLGLAKRRGNEIMVGDDFVSRTQIRVQRSTLASNFVRSRFPDQATDPILEDVQRVSQSTMEVLSDLSSSEDQIRSATDAFKRAIDRIKPTLQKHGIDSRLAITQYGDRAPNHWGDVLRAVAEDTREFASDATEEERKQLSHVNNQCQRLALALGQGTLERLNEDFRIAAVMKGSLAVSDHATLEIQVTPLTETVLPGRLQIEMNGSAISAELDETARGQIELKSHTVSNDQGDYQTTALQRLKIEPTNNSNSVNDPPAVQPLLKARVELHRLALSKRSGHQPDSAINLRWITEDDIYRTSVPIEMPLPPVANAWFAADTEQQQGDDTDLTETSLTETSPTEMSWTMHANRIASRRLMVDAYDASTRTVKVRLIAWPGADIPVPAPMTIDQAKRWYSIHSSPAVLAEHPEMSVERNTATTVLFPPQKIDPAIPAISIGSLWCELTDKERGVVEMIDLSPRVYRPGALIRPTVSYDDLSRTVDIDLESALPAHHTDESTQVHIELVQQGTQRVLAQGDVRVRPGGRQSKSLSAADCQGQPFRVRLTVDRWPSSFVYDFAGGHSEKDVSQAEGEVHVAIMTPSIPIIADTQTRVMGVGVGVDLGDDLFRYGADTITVGLDINGDRYLVDEPSVSVSTPMGIGFTWSGVNDLGQVMLQSDVKPHRLPVPIEWVNSHRSALVAKLQRGSTVSWSQPREVIFDSKPPVVRDVQFVSPLPAVLGAPIEARVTIDDAGLSGAASLQAGWASGGQQEFTPDVKPVPGQKLGDGRWAIILPTDGLVSGAHTVLIQPTDAAGNVGKVKATVVRLLSETQILEARERKATMVQGKVAYVTRPVSGMTVALKPEPSDSESQASGSLASESQASGSQASESQGNPDKSDGKDDDTGAQASNLTKQVQTDGEGRFVFPEVRAGNYELELQGMYMGMRYKKSVRVSVKPPQPSDLSTIRID